MKTTFLLSAVMATLTACSDSVTSQYHSYHEAREARLFERGWLPDFLPRSTLDISVSNDLDSNGSHGSFIIPPADLNGFVSHLTLVDQTGQLIYQEDNQIWTFVISPKGAVKYSLYNQ